MFLIVHYKAVSHLPILYFVFIVNVFHLLTQPPPILNLLEYNEKFLSKGYNFLKVKRLQNYHCFLIAQGWTDSVMSQTQSCTCMKTEPQSEPAQLWALTVPFAPPVLLLHVQVGPGTMHVQVPVTLT